MRTKVLIFAAILIFSVLFISCGESKEEAQKVEQGSIIGTWKGTYKSETLTLSFDESGKGYAQLTPKDGKSKVSIQYTVDGDNIKIVSLDDKGIGLGSIQCTFSVEDDTLFIKAKDTAYEAYELKRINN